jgi:PAS domain S-box-containing protein
VTARAVADRRGTLAVGAAVALGYLALALAGLSWATVGGAGSPVWPAAGFGLAALLLGGARLWPALFLGRLGAAFVSGSDQPLWAEALIAAGVSLSTAGPAFALRRWPGFDDRLASLPSAVALATASAVIATVSAAVGAATLAASSGLDRGRAAALGMDWWFGDVVGCLVVAPLILCWRRREDWRMGSARAFGLTAVLAAVGAVAAAIFLSDGLTYLRTWYLYPLVVVAALTHGVRGVAAALALIAAVALWGATQGLGPFVSVSDDPAVRVALSQQFVAIAALSGVVLAAAADERPGVAALRASEARLRAVLDSLPVGVVLARAGDGQAVFRNARAEAMFGRDGAGFPPGGARAPSGATGDEGRPYGPDDHPVARAARTGETVTAEVVRFRLRDGGAAVFEVCAAPLPAAPGEARLVVGAFQDVTGRRAAEAALAASRSTLQAVFDNAPVGILLAQGGADGVARGNAAFAAIAGGADAVALEALDLRDAEGRPVPAERTPLRRALDGAPGAELECLCRRPDGRDVWVRAQAAPIRDATGAPLAAVMALTDIDAAKRAGERQALLVAELSHRVQNALAVVQAMARRTLATSADLPTFRAAFEGRLAAFAAAHALLLRANWTGTTLRDVVDAALAPHLGGRSAQVAGPALALRPREGVALSMALHELATNAAKHGALREAGGALSVDWAVSAGDRPRVALRWRESGLSAAPAAARRGFGVTLIERTVTHELGGSAVRSDAADGLTWTLGFPLDRLGPEPRDGVGGAA